MKIDSTQAPLRPTTTESKDAGSRVQAGQDPVRSETPSTVTHLSSSERGSSSEVNAARVAELRQAIIDGRLEINPERIADGLIASVREQLGQD